MLRKIVLELDEADYDSIQEALGIRQGMGLWPEDLNDTGESSNIAGLGVAEICRSWIELLLSGAE